MISKLMVDGLWFFEIDVPIYAQDDRRRETMIDRKSVKTDQATIMVVVLLFKVGRVLCHCLSETHYWQNGWWR